MIDYCFAKKKKKKQHAEIDPIGCILCISTHIKDLTNVQYIIYIIIKLDLNL